MTLAPAVATIREMQRLGLVERSAEMGAYLGQKLFALREQHPSIGDVRCMGLFWAVELVTDQQTKAIVNTWQEKLDGKPLVVEQVAAKMLVMGVAIQDWMSHFVLAPALIVSHAAVDQAVAALDDALVLADALLAISLEATSSPA